MTDFASKQPSAADVLALMPSGSVIGSAVAEYLTNTDITTQIPTDNTIPQSNEGVAIIALAYTPKRADSKLRVRFQGQGAVAGSASWAAALFLGAEANARRAGYTTPAQAAYAQGITLEYEMAAGDTSAKTFTLRVGPNSATALRLNGSTASNILGGVIAATLVIEEIKG